MREGVKRPDRVPVVSIVGRSGVGKTTLLEGVIAELKRRGYRVATIKHNVHGFEIDREGKDSWRLARAGSDAVVISSPQRLALVRHQDHDATIEEIALLIGNGYDIVLTEGFREDRAPKIEVHRKGFGDGPLCSPGELIAVATDEPLATAVPQLPLADPAAVAAFIESAVIGA